MSEGRTPSATSPQTCACWSRDIDIGGANSDDLACQPCGRAHNTHRTRLVHLLKKWIEFAIEGCTCGWLTAATKKGSFKRAVFVLGHRLETNRRV